MDRLVCCLRCAEILGECQILGVWDSKSFCMLLPWSKTPQIWYKNVGFGEFYPINIDSIDLLISDLTRGQKVTDFDPRLKSS